MFPDQNRPDVSGVTGAVVAGHPLAAAAGYRVLQDGGNAVDAVVTMAAVLAVVRPHMNGVGGDAFALIYDGTTHHVSALNGSGRSGNLALPAFFLDRGLDRIPSSGPLSVTVPGAVAAWDAALDRFGTISLNRALQPAIDYARNGWVVTSTLDRDINASSARLNEAGQAIFRPEGESPEVGAVLSNRALARTLDVIANGGAEAFYRGWPAKTISAFLEDQGGHLRYEDFQNHSSEWTEPISVELNNHRFFAFPPNSQGLAQLQQVKMAEVLNVGALQHNSSEYLHSLIELKKLAFADRDRWVADPEFAAAPLEELLDGAYLSERAVRVGSTANVDVPPGIGASLPERPAEGDGDTVYLMAVDRWGNGVSWIQSLFGSWGSRLVEPETGVVLQNRGAGFTLQEDHPNRIEPGKRPFHTLSPALVTNPAGELLMTLGTPGGHGQTQFVNQVFQNIISFGMNPQQAVEAPRFLSNGGSNLLLEGRLSASTVEGLKRRGHDVRTTHGWSATFGGVQVILRDPSTGTLRSGADPRREAYGIAY